MLRLPGCTPRLCSRTRRPMDRGEQGPIAKCVTWMVRIYLIAEKDARIYFFKGPNLTFGLFLPLVIYWAFAIDRPIDTQIVIPGLVALAIFFGAGAIQAVSLPLERRTGTIYTLLAAPVTPSMLVLGKALAGVMFGLFLALIYGLVALFYQGTSPDLVVYGLAALFASFCFSAFGLCMAAPFRDVPQAMPPATVVRILLVFAAGTFREIGASWASWPWVSRLVPLTYGVSAMRQALTSSVRWERFMGDLGALFLFGLAFLGLTVWLLESREL